ncbi:hypothetical protein JL721_12392 [Aureococcus anophagefferens]|nr:hypothetical protein JL721_12392 [Aureococcus anophagefferens]
MSDDRFADATARLVAQDPSLTSLSLATRKDIPDAVLAALAASDHCRTAHLEMTAFDDGRCEALRAVGLPACLTALHLTRNAISSTGAAALASALATAPALRSLHLGGNPLGAGLALAAAGLGVLNVSETQDLSQARRGYRARRGPRGAAPRHGPYARAAPLPRQRRR